MRRILILSAAAQITLAAATPVMSLGAQVSAAAVPADSLAKALAFLSLSEEGVSLNGRVARSSTTIAAGDTLRGPLLVVGGSAEVFGVVAGNVYALWGDVLVHDGADIHGTASAYRGRVIIDGGRVRGGLHAWPAAIAAAAAAAEAPMTRGRALQLSAGWAAMMIVVGLLVLVPFAPNLEATARSLEQDFGRAFFLGVVAQLGFIPALLLICLALVATVIGTLLVPFALVAAPVALAGFLTLGWLALALATGRAILRSRHDGASRAEALRALTLGILLLMFPWILAAALQGAGTIAIIGRVAAVGITWVACTAGLGGAVLSRGGAGRKVAVERVQPPLQGWQTPTPVAGVAAARRPIPARPGATPK